jgi:hypothetical protein
MIPIGVHPLRSCDLTIEVKGKIGAGHPSVQSAELRSTARQRFGQASILYDHNVDTTSLHSLALSLHVRYMLAIPLSSCASCWW